MSFSVPITVDQFLGLLLASSLIKFTALREACNGFDTNRTDEDALNELCGHFVSKGVLTKWQCDKLRHGKWKGFYLDGYCFLDHLAAAEKTSTYLAREVSTSKRVVITITPPNLSEYDVTELSDASSRNG